MKIVCLGAGARHFAHILGYVALDERLRGSDVSLYDVDRDRASIMAEAGRRYSAETGANLKVTVSRTMPEAVEGADFVDATIGGVGGSGSLGYYRSPIHINDCLICNRYGVPQLIGDTCGPAAMAAAFRSIPVYLTIGRELEKRAPKAFLFNHANPMAVLCRALNKYTNVRGTMGTCHGVQGGIILIAKILEVPPGELDVLWVGTNHYYWTTRVRHKGKDMLPELFKRARKVLRSGHTWLGEMSLELAEAHGCWLHYPTDDHAIEFYPFLAQWGGLKRFPYEMEEVARSRDLRPYFSGKKTIRQLVAEDRAVPRRKVLAEYRDLIANTKLPSKVWYPLKEDARKMYGNKALPEWALAEYLDPDHGNVRLMADIATGTRAIHILNIPNRGSIPNLPPESVVEVECVSDASGVRGVYMGEAPRGLEAILRRTVAWQEMVVDAAVKGDRKLALEAMLINEQAIPPRAARAMLDELLLNSRKFLPQFRFR